MGTNYYVKAPKCEHCGRQDAGKHLGKSSAGWVFALRVYPDDGINGLAEWIPYWKGKEIYDEYGERVSHAEMLATILLRGDLRRQTASGHKFSYETIAKEFS